MLLKYKNLKILPLTILLTLFANTLPSAEAQSVRHSNEAMQLGNAPFSNPQEQDFMWFENGGLLVMEAEKADLAGSWSFQDEIAGAVDDGYFEWKNGDPSTDADEPGLGILSYTFHIATPGTYRLLLRSAALLKRDHNDVWVRFPDNEAEGRKSTGGSIVHLDQNTWFKVYQKKGGNDWHFEASTVDDNAHEVFAFFNTTGSYRVELSGRSTQFKIDRLVFFQESVSESIATDTSTPESVSTTLPVELVEFKGLVNNRNVALTWTTASELNNAGFDVEFTPVAGGTFSTVGFVAGSGTSTETVLYKYTHASEGFEGQTLYYRLKQLDFDGTFEYSDVVAVQVPITSNTILHPAYPNPFNPSTTISFTLPVESEVSLSVYDPSGRVVQALFNEVKPAGYHSQQFNPTAEMASGMYMYRLVTPTQTLTGTVLLLK